MKTFILGLLFSFSAIAVPDNNWLMKQVWNNLSFTHFEVNEDELKQLLPKGLEVDKYQGRSFVGIITLEMTRGYLNHLPISLYKPFPQVNVRTYVTCNGKRGIYFLNINADHLLGPKMAKFIFDLPYYKANISWEKNNDRYFFSSDAKGKGYEISFKPNKDIIKNDQTTLELWLTDIYRSYQLDRKNKMQETNLWHSPFVIQKLDAKITNDEAFQSLNLNLLGKPSFHYVGKTETYFWKNKEVKCE